MEGKTFFSAKMAGPVSSFLENNYPQIETTTRVVPGNKLLISANEKDFFEEQLIYADGTFLEIFDYKVIKGISENPLRENSSILLTENIANKYFGDIDPIGKSVIVNNEIELIVRGIIENIPHSTHLHFEGIISIDAVNQVFYNNYLMDKMNTYTYTYLKFRDNVLSDELNWIVGDAQQKYREGGFKDENWYLQPVSDIHLYSDLFGEYAVNSNIKLIYVLSSIAILILLIACINYINLSMAFYSRRTREIGLRKIIGSSRWQTIGMFYMEAILMVATALFFTVIIVELILPWFSNLIDRPLMISLKDKVIVGNLFLLTGVIVILVGTIPAITFGKIKPLSLFNKQLLPKTGGIRIFGNLLLLIQFIITVSLVVCSIVLMQQVKYVRNMNLGFHKEAVIVLPLNQKSLQLKTREIKSELLDHSSILQTTAISDLPGTMKWVTSIRYEGLPDEQNPTMSFLNVDEDFIKTFSIQMESESGFISEGKMLSGGYILNQTAVKSIGWEEPVGNWFSTFHGGQMNVIGVMKDFHFKSLHTEIEPLFLSFKPEKRDYNYIVAKINTINITNTMKHIGSVIGTFGNDVPFEYFFYDDYIEKLYLAETRFSKIITIFSGLAILIAIFGLFGIAAYSAEQQAREIGIRKVFGASIHHVLLNMSGDYIKWIFISFLIAFPIAYLAAGKWLENFAYRIEIQWWVFIVAAIGVLIISFSTIIIQSIQTALRNPVDVLRYE
jgi:putative ABC transport system permease protein